MMIEDLSSVSVAPWNVFLLFLEAKACGVFLHTEGIRVFRKVDKELQHLGVKAEARRRAALTGRESRGIYMCTQYTRVRPPHSASRPERPFRNPVLLFLAICSLAVKSLTILRTNMGGDKHRHMMGRQRRVCKFLHVRSKRCWGRKHGRYART